MRRAFFDDRKGLLVLWSHKAACTAVADWFATAVLGWDLKGRSARPLLEAEGLVLYPQKVMPKLPETRLSVAIVRDPFDRALSGFMNKFVVYRGVAIDSFEKLKGPSRRVYLAITGQSEQEAAADYKGLAFTQLCDHMEAMGCAHERDHDNHFNVQYHRDFRKAGYFPDRIIRVDRLNESLDALNRELGLTGLPQTANASPWSQTRRGDLTGVNSLDLCRMGGLAKADLDTPDVRSKIRRAHAVDYAAFGFEGAARLAS